MLFRSEHYPDAASDKEFEKKAALIQERITFFHEAPDMLGYFYKDPTPSIDLIASKKQKIEPADVPRFVKMLIDTLEPISEQNWNENNLEAAIRATVEKEGAKLGQLLWPLRAILTDREYSPGAFEVATVLGREVTLNRLAKFV